MLILFTKDTPTKVLQHTMKFNLVMYLHCLFMQYILGLYLSNKVKKMLADFF